MGKRIQKIKLIQKKECITLTWFSRILILFLFLSVFGYVFFLMPSFLSKSNPAKEGLLVIDGSMPDYMVEEAIQFFHSYPYQKIVVTGGYLISGHNSSGKKTMAELTKETLLELGFAPEKIVVIPGEINLRNRTYSSTITLRGWLNHQKIKIKKMDVITVGCHARRSEYLFQKALGRDFEVGVWAVPDRTYDIRLWWQTSKGARTVISEIIAWFYVRFFSHPTVKEHTLNFFFKSII